MPVDYMTDTQLRALSVQQLDATRVVKAKTVPLLDHTRRVVIELAVPQDLERCRKLVLGLPSGEPAPIAERLHCCLFALSVDAPRSWTFGPDAILDQAQSQLSALLMEHPVLMHPKLRCVELGNRYTPEFQPMPLVVVMPLHARLPMTVDGYSEQQLREWIDHPAPKAGLLAKIAYDASLDPMSAGRSPVEHATHQRQWRPALLASLHDLLALRQDGSSGDEVSALVAAEVLKQIDAGDGSHLALTLATTLLFACEMPGPAAKRFVELVRTSYLALVPELTDTLDELLPASLALGRGTGTTTAQRVHAYATGLVDSGVCANKEAAARKMLMACAAGPNAAFNEIGLAVDFLRSIRECGVVPLMEELMPYMSTKKPMPSWEIAHRQVAAEAAMKSVMDAEVPKGVTKPAPRRGRSM